MDLAHFYTMTLYWPYQTGLIWPVPPF